MKRNSNLYYLDSNFLIAYFASNHSDHLSSKKKMFELLSTKKMLFISTLALDETLYIVKKVIENQVPNDRRKPFRDFSPQFKNIINSISKTPFIYLIQFKRNLAPAIANVLDGIQTYNLKPRDAFHYAYMKDYSITRIVTKDKPDFGKIPTLIISTY